MERKRIAPEQHHQMGLILGYPLCCVEEWVLCCIVHGHPYAERAAVSVRVRNATEIVEIETKISELLGRPWKMVNADMRYIPCAQCAEQSLVKG